MDFRRFRVQGAGIRVEGSGSRVHAWNTVIEHDEVSGAAAVVVPIERYPPPELFEALLKLGFGGERLGFKFWGWGWGVGVEGLGFRVSDLGFKV